jgi:hypothetical protein
VIPANAIHEARERDYFFVLGFWCWGVLAATGIVSIAAVLTQRAMASSHGAKPRSRPAMFTVAIPVLAMATALLPVIANGAAMNRKREPVATMPRVYGRLLLDAVPTNGVLFAAGDNDTFPLWYLQQVEEYRTDVTVVTVPLLGATWFRDELRRRRGLLSAAEVARWPGLQSVVSAVVRNAALKGRPYRVSTLLAASSRNSIDPTKGWTLEGMVYAPSPSTPRGTVALDAAALATWRERVPPSLFAPIPDGIDGAPAQIQELLRCTRISGLPDTLLVSVCHGA